MCVLAWGLQAEGSSDIIFSACLCASCKCRWRKRLTKLKKEGGSSGTQKRRAGLLWKIGISPWLRRLRGACAASGVIFDHEGRLLFLSLSSAAPSECQRFPFKTLTCPRLMSGRMPLVSAEEDWTICTCYINTWPPGPWTLGRAQRHHLASPSIRIKPSWPSSGKLRHDS